MIINDCSQYQVPYLPVPSVPGTASTTVPTYVLLQPRPQYQINIKSIFYFTFLLSSFSKICSVQLQPYKNGDFAETAMARTRSVPKPAARQRPPKRPGSYTNRALALQAKERAERRKLLEKAV